MSADQFASRILQLVDDYLQLLTFFNGLFYDNGSTLLKFVRVVVTEFLEIKFFTRKSETSNVIRKEIKRRIKT